MSGRAACAVALSACACHHAILASGAAVAGARPLPQRQEDFFDLLPVVYPGPPPQAPPDLDPVASRLPSACSSVRDFVALGVAASELHSFTVTPAGYDLSLPDFDAALGGPERAALQRSCRELSWAYSSVMGLALELGALCPQACYASELGSLPARARASCRALASPEGEGGASLDGLSAAAAAERALVRVRRVLGAGCSRWETCEPAAHLAAPYEEALAIGEDLAKEVRIFLDHTFHALGLGPAGLPALPPLAALLERDAPALAHVPLAGQRWDVLRVLLEDLARRRGGLRVAEIGVEKGMTVAALMRSVPAIREYVLVDTWHIPEKPDDFNAVLEGYHRNLQAWASSEPTFQRGNASAARLLRMTSQEAAGHFGDGYFDLVFVDAEHTFADVQRDMAAWKRRVRPDGGVLAGHDFSLFHPAVSLAVLLECGPGSADALRFPLESRGGRPLLRISADSVWWCVRAGASEPRE